MARPPAQRAPKFYELVSEAISEFAESGYHGQAQLDRWLQRLAAAAHQSLVPEIRMQQSLRDALTLTFKRMIDGSGIRLRHKGIDAYTLAAIKPKLRAELDRRILAGSDLIKLNREASVERTLRRFAGWATSIPTGGSRAIDRVETQKGLRKALAQLPFEERRVIIDQSHKLTSAVNAIVATDGGAIAGIWHSHWRESGYDYRPSHKKRDQRIYVLRDNWAMRKGYMKLGGAEYADTLTQPGEEINCRCRYEYLYTLRDLPDDLMTAKGKEALAEARARLAGQRRRAA